jgi:hypothetical protein
MDQSEAPRELERKIDQATRIASHINDQTTGERLRAWIQDMRQRLQQPWRRSKSRTAGSAPGIGGRRGTVCCLSAMEVDVSGRQASTEIVPIAILETVQRSPSSSE